MPIYEYLCEKCGHEFEREQRISDPPARSCPECRGRKVTRLISRTAFVLKGGGWYADGYASKKGGAKDSTTSAKTDEGGEKGSSSTSKETPKSKSSKPTAHSKSGSSSSKSAA